MPEIVNCPRCERKLRVPDHLLGQQVQCPTCAVTFAAQAVHPEPAGAAGDAPPALPPALPEAAIAPGGGSPRPAAGTSICPGCGGLLVPGVRVCPQCGRDLHPLDDDRPWERGRGFGQRADFEPHRGSMILTFGIISICLPFAGPPLGIAAWVMGTHDMSMIRQGVIDPEGAGSTEAGIVCGIIGTILQGLVSFCCLGFFGVFNAFR
jgi:hypothetical protein